MKHHSKDSGERGTGRGEGGASGASKNASLSKNADFGVTSGSGVASGKDTDTIKDSDKDIVADVGGSRGEVSGSGKNAGVSVSAKNSFSWRKSLFRCVATFGYVGFFPKFPGTAASFVTIFLMVATQAFFSLTGYAPAIIFCIGSLIVSIFVVDWSIAHIFRTHDPKQVVLDEVVGMSLAVVVVPFSLTVSAMAAYFVAFVSFRFFDIYKPFPVSYFDNRNKPFYVVLDDVVAGILSWPWVWLTYELLEFFSR